MISKNGVGIIMLVLSLLGVNIAEADVVTTISVIGQVMSVILLMWNQYGRKNIKNFVLKNDTVE